MGEQGSLLDADRGPGSLPIDTQNTASDLTRWPVVPCSWESEQSKNRIGEMVPLYAARVQDLGPGDVVVFRCGACGHAAELPLHLDGVDAPRRHRCAKVVVFSDHQGRCPWARLAR